MADVLDLGGYLRFLLALAFVLGLIGLVALALRRVGGQFGALRRQPGARRLEIAEVLPLDGRRRLVLVRRDGREHLLLLGPQSDLVVERDIEPGPAASADAAAPAARAPGGQAFGHIVERFRRRAG